MRNPPQLRASFSLPSFLAGVAVVLAVGGTAYAAGLITSADVKDNSLKGIDVKRASLDGSDVKNKSLTRADFRGSVRGPVGPTGPTGPAGSTGPAGGDLAGNYPNPTIAPGAVGPDELATGAIPHDGTGSDGSTKLATNSVNFNEIGNGAVHAINFETSGTFTFDIPPVTNTCDASNLGAAFGIPATVDTSDFVLLAPPADLANTDVSVYATVPSDGVIRLSYCADGGGDPGSLTFRYVVIEG